MITLSSLEPFALSNLLLAAVLGKLGKITLRTCLFSVKRGFPPSCLHKDVRREALFDRVDLSELTEYDANVNGHLEICTLYSEHNANGYMKTCRDQDH